MDSLTLTRPRKIYVRWNKSKVDSTETGRIVITHYMLLRSDQENYMYTTIF